MDMKECKISIPSVVRDIERRSHFGSFMKIRLYRLVNEHPP